MDEETAIGPADARAGFPRSCAACLAWEQGACGALSRSELRRLAAGASRRRLGPGSPVRFARDGADQCVSLVSGTVKLSRFLGDGRQQIIALPTAPRLIDPPFGSRPDVGAAAVTEADICVFRRSVLEAIARENPALQHRLHVQALAELEESRELLLTLGRRTARERVSAFLLAMFERRSVTARSEAGPATIDLPLSRSEIGDYLGLTIETVSRQFSQLKRDGIILVPDARRVVLEDPRQLIAAAGQAAAGNSPTG